MALANDLQQKSFPGASGGACERRKALTLSLFLLGLQIGGQKRSSRRMKATGKAGRRDCSSTSGCPCSTSCCTMARLLCKVR